MICVRDPTKRLVTRSPRLCCGILAWELIKNWKLNKPKGLIQEFKNLLTKVNYFITRNVDICALLCSVGNTSNWWLITVFYRPRRKKKLFDMSHFTSVSTREDFKKRIKIREETVLEVGLHCTKRTELIRLVASWQKMKPVRSFIAAFKEINSKAYSWLFQLLPLKILPCANVWIWYYMFSSERLFELALEAINVLPQMYWFSWREITVHEIELV